MTEIGSPPDHIVNAPSTAASSREVTTVEPHPATAEKPQSNTFSQMMKLKTLHILATFILVYVGVEVTMGGTTSFYIRLDDLIKYFQAGLSHLSSTRGKGVLHLDTSPLDSLVD